MGDLCAWINHNGMLPPRELLELVRDPELTYQLELAKQRGELGVLPRQTRDIDVRTASIEVLERALSECRLWHATYPETDDWELVSYLEAVIPEEITYRALAKINGGVDPRLCRS
jgi:hypothetical protein